MAHDPHSAPVPVPASLAALFDALGFELAITAKRVDGAEMSERDRKAAGALIKAFNAQHPPIAPEDSAAQCPDLLGELAKYEAEKASRVAPAAAPARATGTGGE